MDLGDLSPIIVALLTVTIPSLVTYSSSKALNRQAVKNSARQSILQLIMEDHLRVVEKRPPENYQAIMHEYDEYKNNGGNSYIHDKVEEYKKWYRMIDVK